jgi:hypothetical protein
MSGTFSFPELITGSALFGTPEDDVFQITSPGTAYGFGGDDVLRGAAARTPRTAATATTRSSPKAAPTSSKAASATTS